MEKLKRFKEHNPVGKIDRENSVIYGVSVITGNREASGHQMYVDSVMVDQVVEHGNENKQGLKARFDHPNPCSGSMGTVVGRFKNFRRDGLQARADLHLLDSAAESPNGNYRDYILSLAEEDSNAFATSIVFRQGEQEEFSQEDYPERDPEDPFFYPHARIKSLTHCDVVDEGAANDGLFGRPDYLAEQAMRFANENPEAIQAFEPFLLPMIEKVILKNKNMSENKTTLFSRLASLFSDVETKTDEQLSAEYTALKEEAKQLQEQLSDNDNTITELKGEKEELEAQLAEAKEAKETELAELNERITALQSQLAAADGELPEAVEGDVQVVVATEKSAAQLKAEARYKQMRDTAEYIAEQKKKGIKK